ncbi:hypothetical protein [uncultured Zhongshania sp.]|uniref:hypothetical protein n=1 Tax=uncultured Zhongshania sp. TaxID=1642288 RepID=UPI0025E71A3E|nr:hypothetical protein [uncultured Zhongshania sp.]
MKKIPYLILMLAVSVLVACNDKNQKNSAAKLNVDELESGRYTISVGEEEAPAIGKYYAGNGSSRFAFVEGSDGKVAQIYRRVENGEWTAVPNINTDTAVNIINSTPVLDQSVALAELPSSFVTKTSLDKVVKFSLGSNGNLTADAGDCNLVGDVSESDIEGLLAVSLTTANCDLPQAMDGVLVVDKDYQPAVFRLIASDDQEIVDLWVYQE